jgi:hypothetical protein
MMEKRSGQISLAIADTTQEKHLITLHLNYETLAVAGQHR